MGRHARGALPLGIVLDSSQPEPLHRRIWQQLRRAILERRLAPGTRLPSSRLMAAPVAGPACSFGHPGLRAAIASYLGTARGFTCVPCAVVVTSGVQQGVPLFARVALEAGGDVWIEEPGYPGMAAGLATAQVRAVPVPIDASGFCPDAALAMAPHARLAVVAPSHQFPLGTVLTLPRRLALPSWAERTQGWIVEDDFDGEYRYSGHPLAPLRALELPDQRRRRVYLEDARGQPAQVGAVAVRLRAEQRPAGGSRRQGLPVTCADW